MRLYNITLASSLFASVLLVVSQLPHCSAADQVQPDSFNYEPFNLDPSNGPLSTESKNAFVQMLQESSMEVYRKLSSMPSHSKDSRLSILKSTKVRPTALFEALEDRLTDCNSAKMREDLRKVIQSVRDMFPGRDTRLFVVQSNNNITLELEFVCVTVRAYQINGEDACDFSIATYLVAKSMVDTKSVDTKSVDTKSLVMGTLVIGIGMAFGIFALAAGRKIAVAIGNRIMPKAEEATVNPPDPNTSNEKDMPEVRGAVANVNAPNPKTSNEKDMSDAGGAVTTANGLDTRTSNEKDISDAGGAVATMNGPDTKNSNVKDMSDAGGAVTTVNAPKTKTTKKKDMSGAEDAMAPINEPDSKTSNEKDMSVMDE